MFSHFQLHEHLLRALNKLGLEQPTPVQSEAIPVALKKKDLLVSAETGSGKTAAFLLPAFHTLLNHPDTLAGTRVLVLVPTRELGRQIMQHGLALASYTQLRVGLIIGGESFTKQKALLRKNPEIIIATPGRMVEHLDRATPNFDDLEVLILDEADRMLDMGFSEDVLNIAAQCNPQRQTLLFSATLSHKGVKRIASQITQDAQVLTLNTIKDKHANIRQQLILADNNGHKGQLVRWLLEHESFGKALIFMNTKVESERIYAELSGTKLPVGLLHGDLDQRQRNQVMKRLRSGEVGVLIATDVAARGLDVQEIDLVINFDMAKSGKDYVHRIGRTGRAGRKGLAVSLIGHREWNLMIGIERFLKQRFSRRTIAELEGQYSGPKKLKKSGKTVGTKKKKSKGRSLTKSSLGRMKDKTSVKERIAGQQSTRSSDAATNKVKSGNVWARVKKTNG